MSHRSPPQSPNPSGKSVALSLVRDLWREAQVGAFGAQAAFFVLLSAMPFLVFLTAILHYVPWGENDLSRLLPGEMGEAVLQLLPKASPSAAILSLSAVTALWSASRGIVALTRGLNQMYGLEETRNYFLLRFFALAETLILEIALLCTLGGAIRGEEWGEALGWSGFGWDCLRTVMGIGLLTGFFLFLYTVLPDHSARAKKQLPGAVGAAAGWVIFTKGYSVYVEQIADFPQLYGALSNVAMLMLWLWLCLCILLLGAFVNRILSFL